MDRQDFTFNDPASNPDAPPMRQQLQQQQQPQRRRLDISEQTVPNAPKRQRLSDQSYQPNYMQLQSTPEPPACIMQQRQQQQQAQFPHEPQSQQPQMQQQQLTPISPFTSFPGQGCNPYQMFPMQPMQQLQQPQMQPSFPMTSTPTRGNGANFTAPYSFQFTPMGGMHSFFPTPPSSDGSPSSFLGTPNSIAGTLSSLGGSSTTMPPTIQTPTRAPQQDAIIFREVPSVLSLEQGCKVKVTIGELRRRIGAPECLDASQLSKLTRYPKSSFKDFMRTFVSHGFKSKVNEGKSRANGLMSFLLEGEALLLAKDFNKLVSSELSISSLAAIVVKNTPNVPALLQQTEAMREHLSRVRTYLLSAGREPIELARLENEGVPVDQAMKNFSLATHGFGPLAMVAVIESLTQLLSHIEKFCPNEEMVMSVLARLPHLPSTSFNSFNSSFSNSFNSNFSSSFNDSGLGSSFHSTPTSTPTSAASSSSSKRGSTPDVDLSLLSSFPNDSLVYCDSIPHRIAYDCEPVTIGELRRRAHGPEKFTVSLMNSYLRKGKKVDTHNKLRESMSSHGIAMKPIKGLKPTSWSSLTETEAMCLAGDVANYLRFLPASQEMRQFAIEQRDTAGCLRSIAYIVEQAMKGIGPHPAQMRVETQADLELARFALITHHFGHNFYASVMQWLQTAA